MAAEYTTGYYAGAAPEALADAIDRTAAAVLESLGPLATPEWSALACAGVAKAFELRGCERRSAAQHARRPRVAGDPTVDSRSHARRCVTSSRIGARDRVSHPHYESPTVEDIDEMERRNGHRDYVRCLIAWCRALMYERDAALKTIESQERHEPQDSTR